MEQRSNTTDLAAIAAATVAEHEMFPAGSPVLAMVSGGADSMALLHLLAGSRDGAVGSAVIDPGSPLRVLHVNHMLRGDDATADETFVAGECEKLGVDCRVVRFDVAAYATAERLNLEDAGRRVRYRFAAAELDALCTEHGSAPSLGRIAVAHTRDDALETFVMRLLAGSGAGGLAGIPYSRERIVRPLLDATRARIESWLVARGVEWREDVTNRDTSRLRARVRHEVLPALRAANPALDETLPRTMRLIAEEDALLTEMADAFTYDFATTRDTPEGTPEVAFERKLMATLSRPMARRVVRAAVLRAFPDASRLESAHVDALVDGLADDGFARDLPEGLRAFTEYGRMVVSPVSDSAPAMAPTLLRIPGTTQLGPAGRIVAEFVDASAIDDDADSAVFDADALERELVVDSARPGDRMRVLGMDGTRKLSDLLIDAKVPKRVRTLTPVVRDGERVMWLAGVRMSDEARVTDSTRRAVRLVWHRPETM